MKILLASCLLLFSYSANAARSFSKLDTSSFLDAGGIFRVDGLIGYNEVQMKNISGKNIYYHGPILRANFNWSAYKGETTEFFLVGNAKGSFVSNDASSNFQQEDGKFYGYGGGIAFRYMRFILGVDYNFMSANHETKGFISNNLKYNFTTIGYYLNFLFSDAPSGFGLSLQSEGGDISSSSLGISNGSPYKAQSALLFMSTTF